MIKFGQVTEYNEKTGKATITYIRPEACAKCGACGALTQQGTIELKADCKTGDWVRVVLPDEKFLSAAALAYAVPLAGFLGGLAAGYLLSGRKELWAVLGGLAGIGLSLLVLRLADRRVTGRPEWTPFVDEVYDSRPDGLDAIGCHKDE